MKPDDQIMAFTAQMAAVHPELAKPVTWTDFMAIAQRSKIMVRIVQMSHPARLVRLGNTVGIQIKRGLPRTLQTRYGMHELWHFWKDDLKESCIYADDATVRHPREDAADLFAWYVTSPARIFLEPRINGITKASALIPDPSPIRVAGKGQYLTNVAGESFYQSALEAIAGRKTPYGWNLSVEAALICENTNPHDPKAVRVEINQTKVGYLSRDRARRHRQRYGQRTVFCPALIVGGWIDNNGAGDFGVRLDI